MEKQTMKPEQALANLAKVADDFKGTKNDHVVLQESLRVIDEALKQATPPVMPSLD